MSAIRALRQLAGHLAREAADRLPALPAEPVLQVLGRIRNLEPK